MEIYAHEYMRAPAGPCEKTLARGSGSALDFDFFLRKKDWSDPFYVERERRAARHHNTKEFCKDQ